MKFIETQLITPSRIQADPVEAFRVVPHWAEHWASPSEGAEDTELIVVVVGTKYRKPITLSANTFGLLLEVTRFGHSIVTNSNFSKPPTLYAKIAFTNAPEDNTPIGRLIANAIGHEAVKALDSASDLRPANLFKIGAGKPDKDARDLVLRHCERLTTERQSSGTLPASFDVGAYLSNLAVLFDAVDAEHAPQAGD